MTEKFTADEIAVLRPYATNVDLPIFALRNLPEEVVAVLFAALAVGGDGLPAASPALSPSIVKVFQGVLLLLVLSGGVLARYRIVVDRTATAGEGA